MNPAQSSLSSRARRFASIFLPALMFIVVARLAQGGSLNQVLCNSVMWASVGTAFWITICRNAPKPQHEPDHKAHPEGTSGSPAARGRKQASHSEDPA